MTCTGIGLRNAWPPIGKVGPNKSPNAKTIWDESRIRQRGFRLEVRGDTSEPSCCPGGLVGDERRAACTQGRAVDHVGFEVKNLEAFTKKLEADGIKLDRPYAKVVALDIATAFFTDPWGTYIELTEGLDRVR